MYLKIFFFYLLYISITAPIPSLLPGLPLQVLPPHWPGEGVLPYPGTTSAAHALPQPNHTVPVGEGDPMAGSTDRDSPSFTRLCRGPT